MDRSEMKNSKKNQNDKAAKILGRPLNLLGMMKKFRYFSLPNKFGAQPVPVRNRLPLRGKVKVIRYHPKRVQKYSKPISLPKELIRKNRGTRLPKTRIRAVKICSPEELILKAERTKFIELIEKYRSSHPGKPVHKSTPLYFLKKKACQARRRKEKHQLIKDNKDDLVEIFGDAIFKSGWPVSRKEIKFALGIKE